MHETCELVIEETLVSLKYGDITTEDVYALVNPNNFSLTQWFGISKVILEAGGHPLQEECKLKGQQPHGDVVVTGAGNLKCINIIHVIGANRQDSITEAAKKVLEECDKNRLDSVAFPAIGTGSAHLDPKESLKSILKGINEYLTEYESFVSEISIVTFTPDVYQAYLEVMKFEIAKHQNPTSRFKVYETSVELVMGDITEQAVDCILNLTNSTLNQSVGVSRAILNAAGPTVADECKRFGTLTTGVVVTSGGNLKSKHIIHVIGPTTVPAFAPSLDKILMHCKAKGFKTVALPAIGTGLAGIKPTQSIEAILCGMIQCLAKMNMADFTKILIIAYNDYVYNDYLKAFQARESEVIQSIKINMHLLQDCLVNPPNWSLMGTDVYKEVTLHKDSAEFLNVGNNFLNSAYNANIKITNITRVQNQKLWRQYAIHKSNVNQRYPNQENERRLYHGTDYNTTRDINVFGFNRSYGGKNATVHGKGTYFAKNASYSCGDKYSTIDRNGEKHVYQAAVITGKWCLSNSSYVEPPKTQVDPNIRYDTTVNDVNNPTIFVVYNDYGAYPEYLISFKTSN